MIFLIFLVSEFPQRSSPPDQPSACHRWRRVEASSERPQASRPVPASSDLPEWRSEVRPLRRSELQRALSASSNRPSAPPLSSTLPRVPTPWWSPAVSRASTPDTSASPAWRSTRTNRLKSFASRITLQIGRGLEQERQSWLPEAAASSELPSRRQASSERSLNSSSSREECSVNKTNLFSGRPQLRPLECQLQAHLGNLIPSNIQLRDAQ